MKITREELKKWARACVESDPAKCNDCPYDKKNDCSGRLIEDMLEEITKLETEAAMLKEQNEALAKDIEKYEVITADANEHTINAIKKENQLASIVMTKDLTVTSVGQIAMLVKMASTEFLYLYKEQSFPMPKEVLEYITYCAKTSSEAVKEMMEEGEGEADDEPCVDPDAE